MDIFCGSQPRKQITRNEGYYSLTENNSQVLYCGSVSSCFSFHTTRCFIAAIAILAYLKETLIDNTSQVSLGLKCMQAYCQNYFLNPSIRLSKKCLKKAIFIVQRNR